MVRETGLEPVRAAPHAPQTCASADSATLAYFVSLSRALVYYTTIENKSQYLFTIFFYKNLVKIRDKNAFFCYTVCPVNFVAEVEI